MNSEAIIFLAIVILSAIPIIIINSKKRKKEKLFIPEIIFGFYNSTVDSLSLRNEFQLTEKWSGIVNTTISTISHRK